MLRTTEKWEGEKDGKNRNGVEVDQTNAEWRFLKKSKTPRLEVKYQNGIS